MAATAGIAPPRPIPIKDRASILFIEKGRLDVLDGAFVVVDRNGVRTHIPVGGLACLMLEPGARVKRLYEVLARRHGVKWKGRRYEPGDWNAADLPNRCLSQAPACRYGLTEAAVLAAGYAPAIGFLHTGKPQSFVYDVADVYKFETVVPIAFQIAGLAERRKSPAVIDPIGEVRRGCRDSFRKTGLLSRLIPGIEDMLASGGVEPPSTPDEAQPIAIPEVPSGDVGHRG